MIRNNNQNDHTVLSYTGIHNNNNNNLNLCTKDFFDTDADDINFSINFGVDEVSESVVKLTTAH
jgi:hypothetical protein